MTGSSHGRGDFSKATQESAWVGTWKCLLLAFERHSQRCLTSLLAVVNVGFRDGSGDQRAKVSQEGHCLSLVCVSVC